MKFMSRLGKASEARVKLASGAFRTMAPCTTSSVVSIDSKAAPGVRFAIHRISFGRRMELSRRVREISRKAAVPGGGHRAAREDRS